MLLEGKNLIYELLVDIDNTLFLLDTCLQHSFVLQMCRTTSLKLEDLLILELIINLQKNLFYLTCPIHSVL